MSHLLRLILDTDETPQKQATWRRHQEFVSGCMQLNGPAKSRLIATRHSSAEAFLQRTLGRLSGHFTRTLLSLLLGQMPAQACSWQR